MTSGGARYRSGPAKDPNALRRDRKDDAAWTELPSTGRQGRAPAWPLQGKMLAGELGLWRTLWRRPQAIMWEELHLELQVASYVRAYLESVRPNTSAASKNAVLRMQEDLGLSISGLARHGWKISRDELGARRSEQQSFRTAGTDVRTRLRAVNNE
ncbi:MAG: hypothetical protein LCH36_10300 [Actinobacteria bacterium]|nr:hypothetical protein [Actinomycetota bacterium]